MKQRDFSNQKKIWGGKYSNEGQVDFTLNGYVDSIYEDTDNEEDFVKFFITNPIKKDNICLFQVTCPWDLGQLEEGDHVNIFGVMRTWAEKGSAPRIELVAQQIEEIKEEKKTKGRRGVKKPVED